MKSKRIAGCMVLGVILIFGACNHSREGESARPRALGKPAQETAGGELRGSRSATVRSIQLKALESFPVKIGATLSGVLPDGCTRIEEIETVREGNIFHIRLHTERPAEALCTMALVPFEETVVIDTAGLPPGGYTVEAGDLAATFRLGSPEGGSSDLAPKPDSLQKPR
jgi:hypothetical protein